MTCGLDIPWVSDAQAYWCGLVGADPLTTHYMVDLFNFSELFTSTEPQMSFRDFCEKVGQFIENVLGCK